MAWTFQLTVDGATELAALAADQRAHFMRIKELIEKHGLERVRYPHVEHLQGELWEIRIKGATGIARCLYVTRHSEAGRRSSRLRLEDTEDTGS
jgi:phage-related protein